MLLSINSRVSRDNVKSLAVRAAGASLFGFSVLPAAHAAGAVLEEIVVTAQRYEQTLQTTPVSVMAVNGDQLASMGLDSLKSSEAFLPNVSIGSALGTGTGVANFSIRGIGGGVTGLITADNAVGVYVDDILLAHPNGAFLDMIDVERLEVLRGPQGTLFGRNTAGGAVRYVSKKPTNEFGGNVKATIGTYNRRDLTSTVNVPLSDTFSTRLSFAKKDRDGYIYRLTDGVSTGDDHVSAARGQFRWRPNEKLDINVSADSTHSFDHGTASNVSTYVPTDGDPVSLYTAAPTAASLNSALQIYTPASVTNFASVATDFARYNQLISNDKYTVIGGNPDRDEFSSTGFSASIQYELADNLSIKSLSGYNRYDQHQVIDTDKTPIVLQQNDVRVKSEYFTQEFQLTGRSFTNRLTWVAGVFYYHDNSSDHRLRVSPRDIAFNNPENKDQTTESYAIFGQGTFKFNDIFRATAGLRWSRDKKDIAVFRGGRGLLGGISQTIPASENWSSVTPKIGFEQQWTADFMTYISAAKGFKAGGFNDTVSSSFTPATNSGIVAYKPENLWTYEVGFRSEFLDHRIRLNGTAFYTDYKDIQVIQTVLPPVFPVIAVITTNLGTATVKGAELDAVAAITDKLTLKLGGGYTKSEYDKSVATLTNGAFNSSVPFLRSPEWSYTVAANYNQPLANDAVLAIDVNWGWKDWQLSSSQPGNATYMPSYGLLNGRVEYQSGKNWSIALLGTNLLNKYYIVGGIDAAGPASKFTYGTGGHNALFGFSNVDVGRPREAGVEFTYKF